MRLRLYHHHDGARVAYREAGTGPALALLHSALLSHREWEPLVEELCHRFRLVLPDLPLHGHSEDRPEHPYTPQWLAEVLAGFLLETCGPRPLVAGHDLGAQLLIRAVIEERVRPARMVLMPNCLHGRSPRYGIDRAVGAALRLGSVPGFDWAVSHAMRAGLHPALGVKLSHTGNPAAADLIRHAVADFGGNTARARAWAAAAAAWPPQPDRSLLDAYAGIGIPVLLLWADHDGAHPESLAEEALDLLPDADLRVLPDTGFLMAYDDPIGLAREISSFCG